MRTAKNRVYYENVLSTGRLEQSHSPPTTHFWKVFWVCGVIAVAPLWLNKYIPMVDLPQHATQIFAWVNYDNPAYPFKEQLQFNWLTPYLLGYAIARFFAFFMPPMYALKAVITLSVLGVPLALYVLLRTTERQPWWALLGFPAAYSFNFFWGLLNFICAVPLALLFIALGFSYVREQTRRKSIAIIVLALMLLLTHAVAFAFAMVIVIGMVAATSPRISSFASRAVPLAVPTMLCVAWILLGPRADRSIHWMAGIERLPLLPALALSGMPENRETFLYGLAVIAVLLVFAEKPRRGAEYLLRLFPLLGTLGIYVLCPFAMHGYSILYPRFAAFLIPALALMVKHEREELKPLARALIVVLVVAWSVVLAGRFHAFDLDARGFDEISRHMEPNRSVHPAIFDPFGDDPPAPVFQHFPAYYQAEKGGVLECSFFRFPQVVLTYRPQFQTKHYLDVDVSPSRFSWAEHGGADYFVVRADRDVSRWLFREGLQQVGLKAQAGRWWLYEKLPKR